MCSPSAPDKSARTEFPAQSKDEMQPTKAEEKTPKVANDMVWFPGKPPVNWTNECKK